MNPELHQKLLAADAKSDLQHWEYPLGFTHTTYTQLIQKVRDVALALGTGMRASINVEDGASIQDASFAAQISIHREEQGMFVRFSNFFPLVTVMASVVGDLAWSAPRPEDPDFQTCIRVLEQHGFQRVDGGALMQTPYEGKLPVRGDPEFTWWTRFFDYL